MEGHGRTAVYPASSIVNFAPTRGTVLPILPNPGDLVTPDVPQQAAPGTHSVCEPNDTIREDIQASLHEVEQTEHIGQDLNETEFVGAIKLLEEVPVTDRIQVIETADENTSAISPA